MFINAGYTYIDHIFWYLLSHDPWYTHHIPIIPVHHITHMLNVWYIYQHLPEQNHPVL